MEFGALSLELRNLVYGFFRKTTNRSSKREGQLLTNTSLKNSDVSAWLNQTKWATNNRISRIQLDLSMEHMKRLGILKSKLALADFLTNGKLNPD